MSTMQFFGDLKSGATFSEGRLYRYCLWRRWAAGPIICFVGLNPSTANETRNDRTVTRCSNFAKGWTHTDRRRYGGMLMINLFAFVSTEPTGLRQAEEPIGPLNDAVLDRAPNLCDSIVCCWGNNGVYRGRGDQIRDRIFETCTRPIYNLGLTEKGEPKHASRLREDTQPVIWRCD